MKKHVLSSLAGLSLVVGVSGAGYAQTTLKATVPFEFAVSGKVLPDGAYAVTRNMSGSVKIESHDGTAVVLALTHNADSRPPKEEATLVFDCIGNRYFLRQIWEPGNESGVEIPRSKMERELIKRSLASVSPDDQHPAEPEMVYIVGRMQ